MMIRLGQFTIARLQLFDESRAAALMKDIVVFHTTARFDRDEITYFATHPSFSQIQQGEAAPVYEAVFDGDQVTWARRHD